MRKSESWVFCTYTSCKRVWQYLGAITSIMPMRRWFPVKETVDLESLLTYYLIRIQAGIAE